MPCNFDVVPLQALLFDFSTDAMVLAEQEMVEEDKKRDIELQRVRMFKNTAVPLYSALTSYFETSWRFVGTSGQRAVHWCRSTPIKKKKKQKTKHPDFEVLKLLIQLQNINSISPTLAAPTFLCHGTGGTSEAAVDNIVRRQPEKKTRTGAYTVWTRWEAFSEPN